ncbi:MAG: lytic transglycosylase domain-containing protein [Pseudomonadota bacterium]
MRYVLVFLLALWAAPVWAEPPDRVCSTGKFGHVQCIRDAHFVHDTCQMLWTEARLHGLDPGFFARLIWQESRFDPNALSPANAMGIAQFIASTAALRGLDDPYNPAQALEHSAEYLGEMQRKYGNAGLAAVGYNGGERRAEGLIAKTGGLARETINYVQIITGLTAETWRDAPPQAHDFRLSKTQGFIPACYELARDRRLTAFPKPPAPKPTIKPWGVQLAFGGTQDAAKRAFSRRVAQCPGPTAGETAIYIKVKNRVAGRPGYYMARIGRDTRSQADALCRRIAAAGCLCRVYKN